MAEKLCLQWNDFKDNAIDTFGSLREDKDFTDVTLVCEDGMKIDVHKVILANSSPFFDNVLRQNKHIHPLIYMRGVKSEDLFAIVDFLYHMWLVIRQRMTKCVFCVLCLFVFFLHCNSFQPVCVLCLFVFFFVKFTKVVR